MYLYTPIRVIPMAGEVSVWKVPRVGSHGGMKSKNI